MQQGCFTSINRCVKGLCCVGHQMDFNRVWHLPVKPKQVFWQIGPTLHWMREWYIHYEGLEIIETTYGKWRNANGGSIKQGGSMNRVLFRRWKQNVWFVVLITHLNRCVLLMLNLLYIIILSNIADIQRIWLFQYSTRFYISYLPLICMCLYV